ncbi:MULTISPECIES: carbon-nitrogen hydrolase family protein [Pseudomonas]|uniref:carbon-nitrogen hydrolase family protein n=1 Tax=Pseudomonas TaxID=286 RepID=UPI0006B9D0A4|nr:MULTISPECIES: carbon-nitrogen hydrolase family protein [Pseudomonas]KPB26402.1 Nitrilase/cyanide hydratase and apolipoprotein N-acyltransferase [Pseudomonas syringae pv. syringae]KTC03219.1 hydrolase [Pseudomonas sp. ICMP 10191]MCK9695873.1 carbon-nitrogen hydrolase family protein [Pseudomonas syringae pv. syringae]MCK9712820.1 carbon-nitrogen hydrolase family protein [Pseudomonas syringae pv. syringae]MCK9716317.1 carbon-nitrogen hydrolase family protein [Pseudomonas syringae pv. syringae]
MTFPILAAAQFCSARGAIEHNLSGHLAFMQRAAEQGATYLLFPELSLTGYEPDLARELALLADDVRLAPLAALAVKLRLTTTLGVPLKGPDDSVLIGALTFTAAGDVIAYAKQYLHPGEDVVFSAGNADCYLPLGQQRIGLCVCADFAHAEHARRLAQGGAWVYAASVLISPGGYDYDAGLLSGHARRHSLPVLMANHGGPTGGWQSAGRSGLWDEEGRWVGGMEGEGGGLVVATRQHEGWQVRAVTLE